MEVILMLAAVNAGVRPEEKAQPTQQSYQKAEMARDVCIIALSAVALYLTYRTEIDELTGKLFATAEKVVTATPEIISNGISAVTGTGAGFASYVTQPLSKSLEIVEKGIDAVKYTAIATIGAVGVNAVAKGINAGVALARFITCHNPHQTL